MSKIKDPIRINRLTFLFACTYMVSYITRTNYGAIISEMQTATSIPRSLLSMALTGSFITYGTGQLISGIIGDRFSPKKLISIGLFTTIVMNLLIPFCKTPHVMTVIWCINGFAQSFMWPPIVKILTMLLDADDYKRSIAKVCWGSSIGTITVYLFSPVIISAANWRWVFVFAALCGMVMLWVWVRSSYNNIECAPAEKVLVSGENVQIKGGKKGQKQRSYKFLSPLIIGIMAAIVLQGMLRDGVTTWMPSYISETYQLSNAVSILSGVVMPIFSILCTQLATGIYMKWFKNPLTCAGICFLAGTCCAFALYLLTGGNAAVSVLFSAILTGCMHGVNVMLICMIPPFFEKTGNVSTVSGMLNACTYIGSAISTYGIAVLSERIGWHKTIFVWGLIGAAGTICCLIFVHAWKRRFMQEKTE